MSHIRPIVISAICAATSLFAAPPVHAVQRTHVSAAFGNDANTASNCTAAAPCRFFQAAMTVTDENGEVVVLDSGGYGAVTITKSLALIAPTGVYAGISVFPGANGVNIATPGVSVVLRGLTINGQGGNFGISMTAGNNLSVESCVISNLSQGGIDVSGVTNVYITDTLVHRNTNNGIVLRNGVSGTIVRTRASAHNGDAGIRIEGSADSTTTTADIADSTLAGNRDGVNALAYAFGGTAVVKVSIRDSRVVQNRRYGIGTESNFASVVSVSASNNIVSNNSLGIVALNARVRVFASGNTVSDNSGSGLFNGNGGVFESAGNNAVRNNGAINSGTITTVATQ